MGDNKLENTIGSIGALLVLFSAMLDPRISIALAALFLVALAITSLVDQEVRHEH